MANEVIPEHEVYKFITSTAGLRLGELYLLRADLDAAYDALALYFAKYPSSEQTPTGEFAVISASLFRDGIVLFCACFSTKDKAKLNPSTVYGGREEWMEYAQTLLDIRDAFVAHNFGPQRQHNVIAVCLESDGKLVPIGITQFHTRFAGWVASEGENLLPFIDVAREHIKGLIEQALEEVFREIDEMGPSDLEALEDATMSIPERSDFRSSRSRFREDGRGVRRPIPPRRSFQKPEDAA